MKGEPKAVMSGQAVVGPDGTLALGPYGCVRVAGLTLDQAQAVIEKQLSPHIANPRVSLHTLTSESSVTVHWRPAKGSGDRCVAQQDSPITIARASYQLPAPASETNKTLPDTTGPFFPPHGGAVESVPDTSHLPPTSPPPHLSNHPHFPGHPPAASPPPVPREGEMAALPPYVVGPPDILLVESTKGLKDVQPVKGPHLIRPDGTINVGIYGSVFVAGMTLDQVREAVSSLILARLDIKEIEEQIKGTKKTPLQYVMENTFVDVLAYNSKVYYVITDGGGYGEQVFPFPVTGNDTVLDAVGKIYGLPPVASKKHIWVARRTLDDDSHPKILPVDWCGITQRGFTATNYQLLPGDRVYVKSDWLRELDARLAKVLAPIERVFGAILLGSETVQSLRGRTGGGGGGTP
jgi:polysaccharide export outer membrane protein